MRAVAHELIWAPLIAGAFLGARFLPHALDAFRCPFHWITGLPCPFCGGTRSMKALAVLDLPRALEMNPLVAVLALAGILYVLHALRVAWTRRPWRPAPSPAQARGLRIGAALAVGANWAYLIAVGR